MPLARLLRLPDRARRSALQARAFARGPEPESSAAWRPPTATASASAGTAAGPSRGSFARPTPLERPQPARTRGRHPVADLPRARARLHRHRGAADQLPPVPLRHVALDAQRPHHGFAAGEARARCWRSTPSLFPSSRASTDSELMFYLALTIGLEDGSAGRGGAHGRIRRGRGPPPRHRAPDADVARHVRRARPLGVPLLHRAALALALLQHRHQDAAQALPRRAAVQAGLR